MLSGPCPHSSYWLILSHSIKTLLTSLRSFIWQLHSGSPRAFHGSQIYKWWTAGFSPDQLHHHENNFSPQLHCDLDRMNVIATIFLIFTWKTINVKNVAVRDNQAIRVKEREQRGVLQKLSSLLHTWPSELFIFNFQAHYKWNLMENKPNSSHV